MTYSEHVIVEVAADIRAYDEEQASLKTMAGLMDDLALPFPNPRNHCEEIENARHEEKHNQQKKGE